MKNKNQSVSLSGRRNRGVVMNGQKRNNTIKREMVELFTVMNESWEFVESVKSVGEELARIRRGGQGERERSRRAPKDFEKQPRTNPLNLRGHTRVT
jgi:hypothetical protein